MPPIGMSNQTARKKVLKRNDLKLMHYDEPNASSYHMAYYTPLSQL